MFVLYSTMEADMFTKKLFNIYDTTRKEGITQARESIIFAIRAVTDLNSEGKLGKE